jgi:hypothetical protein
MYLLHENKNIRGCLNFNRYIVYFSFLQVYCDGYIFPRFREWFYMWGLWKMSETQRKHLKQEIKFKCTTDSCTAAFCEKGELFAHQTSHGEQKRITCNYCNHKLSGNITELTRQRFFHMFGENYIFRTTHIFLWIKWL